MDDLPDDLIDRLTMDYMARAGCRRRDVCVLCRDEVGHVLAALAEWAAGALLDPDGWRRLDATHPDGIAYCIVHDEPAIEGHDPTGDCRPDTYGCIERNLWALTERETTP